VRSANPRQPDRARTAGLVAPDDFDRYLDRIESGADDVAFGRMVPGFHRSLRTSRLIASIRGRTSFLT